MLQGFFHTLLSNLPTLFSDNFNEELTSCFAFTAIYNFPQFTSYIIDTQKSVNKKFHCTLKLWYTQT
jgi:hypothetical protein